jgi:D-glycero-D-manno-heptose 1,7-bisphosphate phosphatase
MKKAVFLDRDGVLNIATVKHGKPYPPDGHAKVQLVLRVRESLQILNKIGFMLFCITNQPDVARGTRTRKEVEKINDELCKQLPLDDFMVCYHDNHHQCMCRKPKPGMLLKLAKKHEINLAESYMVGDRWGDIMAGLNAGCKTIFIDYNYDEKKPVDIADFIVSTLTEGVRIILNESIKKKECGCEHF